MRKMITALLFTLLLTGCATPSGERDLPSSSAVRTVPAPEAQAENMSSSMVESSARPLPEAEILAAYQRAEQVYGWFDLAPLPLSGESASIDGRAYYRVDIEGIEELEDLRACLRGLFSQELTDRLLDGRSARIQYRDVDGVLFASGDSREREAGKVRVQIEGERLEEGPCSVNVAVDLLGEDRETVVGLESWSFPYAFVNDRWVFTEFQLVS